MSKLAWAGLLAAALSGCAGGGAAPILPIPVPVPVALAIPLDGQWILTDALGGRFCLVIQEDRVSILNLTCSADGSGFVPRITDAPKVTLAGGQFTLSVTFNPRSFDSTVRRLSFTGVRQIDGTIIGTRFDSDPADPDETRAVAATMTPL